MVAIARRAYWVILGISREKKTVCHGIFLSERKLAEAKEKCAQRGYDLFCTRLSPDIINQASTWLEEHVPNNFAQAIIIGKLVAMLSGF